MIGDTLAIVRGWMECVGPVTATELADSLALTIGDVQIALAALESEGQVFQGRYRPQSATGEIEWCNRRILARIHRLTLGKLRREIDPVTAAQFHRFLLRWQHVAVGTQLHGADGALQIVKQLQGLEIPASAWEQDVFSRRIAAYEPENIDDLCLSGEVAWARLSPHPALGEAAKRVRPTRIAPISFFLREDADWLIAPDTAKPDTTGLSHAAQAALQALSSRGASFFADLVKATTHLPSEIEDALWELTAAGLVTADGFENLRSPDRPQTPEGRGTSKQASPASCRRTLGARDAHARLDNIGRTHPQTRRTVASSVGASSSATCSRANQ